MLYSELGPKSIYRRNIFLICSVRNATDEQKRFQKAYMDKLEERGHKVFWPTRDNHFESTDKVGYDIVNTNLEGIRNSDEVHIIFDPKSEGSIGDLESAMALKKPIYLVNSHQLRPTESKSFTNLVLFLDSTYEPSIIYAKRYGFANIPLDNLLG